MAELTPLPFAALVTRLFRDLERGTAVFGLPSRHAFRGAEGADLSVGVFGHRAATPFGPAAGPHTQLAQNIVLAWLAGGRVMELKTVQILDRLTIPRPCIDMETVGFNVEWSQELTLERSRVEYVKAAMLIEMLKAWGFAAPGFGDTVFDMSVGYDLAGIRSAPVRAFLDGLRDATPDIDRLRREIPAPWARFRDLPYPARVSDTLTLSTFHGCPPDEIERIAEYLLGEMGLGVVVKLNPTLLGRQELNAILHDRLGHHELVVPDAAFERDADWARVEGIVGRLGERARSEGRGLGVKFTNTLLVRNHKSFFPPSEREMYLSGPPLHVLAIQLVARFRQLFGDRFPVSFSAGVDAGNFADTVALGLKPVSVCTDLLKTGGYARGHAYLEALARRMRGVGAADLDTFALKAHGQAGAALDGLDIAEATRAACRAALADGGDPRAAAGDAFAAWVSAARVLNAGAYADRVLDDPRYRAEATGTPPKKTGVALAPLDCQTCDRCIPVCPNAAIFTFAPPKGPLPAGRLTRDGAGWRVVVTEPVRVVRPHQIAIFADACNECGNCGVFCPEDGGPFAVKPRVFGTPEAWAETDRDGFVLEPVPGGVRLRARLGGAVVTLEGEGKGTEAETGPTLRFTGAGFDVTFDPADPAGTARGFADAPVDLGLAGLLTALRAALRAEGPHAWPGAILAVSGPAGRPG